MADHLSAVQEMQGLYGPFTIAERVVQKIWLRRDFDQNQLCLVDGRRLEIRSPGAWNLLGGPDFKQARLAIGGEPVTGDVEVHFHVADWRAHGHVRDPAYANVVLHVVLFPPGPGEAAAKLADGREIPTLGLLPLLFRSLEEHASDEALESLTARDAAERIADLAALPKPEMLATLRKEAQARWAMKRRFAALRIKQLGWTAALHQTALEILGYRRNRAVMLSVATRHDLAEWGRGLESESVYQEWIDHWQLQGVRPANHPRLRLRQYQGWVAAEPAWPEKVRSLLAHLPGSGASLPSTAAFRRQADLATRRERLGLEIVGGGVGGSRLDTLICDGFLPLLAAETEMDLGAAWFHWYLGDVPFDLHQSLGMLGVAGRGGPPFCHGWGQGLLGWMAERDSRASG